MGARARRIRLVDADSCGRYERGITVTTVQKYHAEVGASSPEMSEPTFDLSSPPCEVPDVNRERVADVRFSVALFVATVTISLLATAVVTGFHAIEPGDEQEYFALAVDLLQRHAFPSLFRTPAYPIALAAVFSLTGPSVAAGKVFNCILGGLTPLGVYRLGETMLPRRAAMLAGAITVVQPTVFFVNATLYSETLSTVAFLWTNVALVRLMRRADAGGASSARPWLLAGALLGLLTLVKPQHALWLPFLILAAVWRWRASLTRAASIVALAAIGFCATMAPWWARNAWVTGGSFVPLTTSGAKTLVDANNPTIAHMQRQIVEIEGRTLWIGPGKFIHHLRDNALVDANALATMNEVQTARYFQSLALTWIRDHPAEWLILCVHKLGYAFSVWPIWQGSAAHTMLGVSFLPILLLSLPGWVVIARHPGPARILLTHVATFVLVTILFFGSWRYRNPYEGSFTLAAAVGLTRMFPRLLSSEEP